MQGCVVEGVWAFVAFVVVTLATLGRASIE